MAKVLGMAACLIYYVHPSGDVALEDLEDLQMHICDKEGYS
jgi:hypothetical protein